jgi:hypothetical protein
VGRSSQPSDRRFWRGVFIVYFSPSRKISGWWAYLKLGHDRFHPHFFPTHYLLINLLLSIDPSIHPSIDLSIYLSTYLLMALQPLWTLAASTYLPTYSSAALVDLGRFCSFLIYTQSVRLLRRRISPSQGRYLHTEQHKHRLNEHIHTCLEWDSNPRPQCSSGRRRFMP